MVATKKKAFTCSQCGKTKTPPPDSITTGYGMGQNGEKVCFQCCGENDKQTMRDKGHSKNLPLYLCRNRVKVGSGDTRDGAFYVSNWPNTLRFPVYAVRKGRHNIAGSRLDVWFAGPDGYEWHGAQYGEWTQIVHCKRTKREA